jgi:hypothetical protein
MTHFVKIEVGKPKAPLIRWLDFDKVCLVAADWQEGQGGTFLSSVRVLFPGGVQEVFRVDEGAQEVLDAFQGYLERFLAKTSS